MKSTVIGNLNKMKGVKVIEFFETSIREFANTESTNILNGISERNLCGRLALILETNKNNYNLNEYYADTEYNRKQNGRIKTILNDNMEEITINCDLIFHSRGESITRDNLIAIEMKKSERPEHEKISDRNRLRAMTKASYNNNIWSNDGTTHPEHVCGYELGTFVELNKGERTIKIEYFQNGDYIRTINLSF